MINKILMKYLKIIRRLVESGDNDKALESLDNVIKELDAVEKEGEQ